MKTPFLLGLIMLFVGCSQSYDSILQHNLYDYQGIWRDTIHIDEKSYMKELSIHDNTMEYCITDSETQIIHEKQSGTIILGNENKIIWNCISSIDRKVRQTYWEVLNLSKYQMRLYSNILGEHNYKKDYYSFMDKYKVQDTLVEMMKYGKYLSLSKDELIKKCGTYNNLASDRDYVYLINHPLFNKIYFKENYDNDSIGSYTLSISIKNWYSCSQIISDNFTKLRDVDRGTEYIDANSLEYSKNVFVIDSALCQITFIPVKYFDYWPNVSQYIGTPIETFKSNYSSKYIYKYCEDLTEGLFQYSYQAEKDNFCTDIYVIADSLGIINYSGVILYKIYLDSNSKKAEAQRVCEKISSFLKMKYLFDRYELDNQNNKVYYYWYNPNDDTKIEVKLRLRYYQENVRKYYRIQIEYKNIVQ